MYKYTAEHSEITVSQMLKPIKTAQEVTAEFLQMMQPFPLGNLLILESPETLDTATLFYDCKRGSFFACTVNILLDLHAAHLDAEARERQRKAINAARFKAERVGKHGQDAEARHARNVAEIAAQRRKQIYKRLWGGQTG